MKIYNVYRWGCDHDMFGVDGPDTNFLVRAENHIDAAKIADSELQKLPHKIVQPFSNVLIELGQDLSENNQSVILLGPCYESPLRIGGYKLWTREKKDSEWIITKDIYK